MTLRVAILACDDFSVLGGAEKHIMNTARALDADIICPTYNEDIVRVFDDERKITFLPLQKRLPGEPYKQIFGKWLYSHLDLNYDFYIAMDDMAVHFLKREYPHLYYMFTPRRALYDMYYPYLEELGLVKRFVYRIVLGLVRNRDRNFVKKNVQNIACISHTVRNRIFKQYQRYAEVIYPAIHTEKYRNLPSEGYWLSTGRVDKWKRIDLQLDAFRKMPDKKLLIAGPIYPKFKNIVNSSPPNVQFLGPISEEHLHDLYSRCEGFITTAIDEDFGITPVEAMASGKPVVATKEGGYLETVIDGITGYLVAPDVHEICEAIEKVSLNSDIFCTASQNRVRMFDYKIFKNNMISYVKKYNSTLDNH